jgi:4-hydroxy-2-oxoheptanedioate aldolase
LDILIHPGAENWPEANWSELYRRARGESTSARQIVIYFSSVPARHTGKKGSLMRCTAKLWTIGFAAILSVAPLAAQQGKPTYNTAKQKLLSGKQIFSYTITTFDPELYCQVAPHYDFIWLEMQHSTLTWADLAKMIAACPGVGVPMVRLPDEAESTIQHATDIGALGMIEPTVDTVEKAEAVAKFAKYPPEGRRSQGGGQYQQVWSSKTSDYHNSINDNMLVVVMIETPIGAANAYDIARVRGVDAVLIANTDLGNFSGAKPDSEEYQHLVKQIHDGTLRAGKVLGATSAAYATGRPDSKDMLIFQNGPSFDGYQPPNRGRGGRGGRGGANSQ